MVKVFCNLDWMEIPVQILLFYKLVTSSPDKYKIQKKNIEKNKKN